MCVKDELTHLNRRDAQSQLGGGFTSCRLLPPPPQGAEGSGNQPERRRSPPLLLHGHRPVLLLHTQSGCPGG